MTKKSKEEKVIHHHIKEVEIKHSQEKDASTTREVGAIHYKRGYMAQNEKDTKLGHHCSECKDKSVSQEEFDKMVKVLLNTPPRKRNGKRKQFKLVYNHLKSLIS